LRIATWNINGVRARVDFLRHWLASRQPDIVGLQELKVEEGLFPTEELSAAGYHSAVFGQSSWNGVAVLSRDPARIVQAGLPGADAAGARLLTVEVSGIHFTSVYIPNGKTVQHDDFASKLAWLDRLVEYAARRPDPGTEAVIGGDFNLCPSALDTWDEVGMRGHIFHTDEERSRWSALLDGGWYDLYREHLPEARQFSWWDYRAGAFHKGHGLRIDFLLGTSAIRDRVVDAVIDRDYRKKKDGLIPSDHAPVYVDLG
jgi:exodeoxyribonuclease-3